MVKIILRTGCHSNKTSISSLFWTLFMRLVYGYGEIFLKVYVLYKKNIP